MRSEEHCEALVVGAGPVGMLTALVLAEGGIQVKIIEQEQRLAARSYACALHPRGLHLLQRLGLGDDLLQRGRRIETIGFYEGDSRRAEVKLSSLPGDFPFVLTLPQSDLEELLEQRLQRTARTHVHWSHRLATLKAEADTVVADVDKLGISAKGYVIPEMDWEVMRTVRTRAAFVVGADGHHSHVRQCLGLEHDYRAARETFVVYEFEAEGKFDHEARVVLAKNSTSVFWPLSDTRGRWTFQLVGAEDTAEFPAKDREVFEIEHPPSEGDARHHLHQFLADRAPWFENRVKEIDWATVVQFEHRLAERFGRERCWLAGDAAHQTGPVGVQSLNLGLCEAAELAMTLKRILREGTPLCLLEEFNARCREEWQTLLGLNGGLKPRAQANPWIKEHCARILPCLPSSGQDVVRLANQLDLDLE